MSIPLTINGVTFQYPQQFDKNWGPTLTNWSSAVTSGMLQTSGVNAASLLKSASTNPASTGFLRLARTDTLSWRNQANNADLPLAVNSSNQLTFNGVNIGATVSLTDGHIFVGDVTNQPADVAMSGDISITDGGVTAIGAGAVTNAKVSNSAAIAWSKLATGTPYAWVTLTSGGVITGTTVTASRAIASDSNGLPVASTTTGTELGYVSGVTSAIQTQIDSKVSKAGDTMSGDLNMASHKILNVTPATTVGGALAYDQNIPFPDGTTSLPGLFADNETNTGIVRASAGTLGVVTVGTQRLSVSSSSLTSTVPYRAPNGSAATPAISFTNASDAGLSLTTTGHETLGIGVNGANLMTLEDTVYIGDNSTHSAQVGEKLVVYRTTDGTGPNPQCDLTVANFGQGDARVNVQGSIADAPNEPVAYIASYGSGRAGDRYWPGGPFLQKSVAWISQTVTAVMHQLVGCQDIRFWSGTSALIVHLLHGSTPSGDDITITNGVVDMHQNQVQNVVMDNESSDPGSPVQGQVYFNTVSKHFFGYNGTAWKQLDN